MNVPRITRRCRVIETGINADAAKRIFERFIDEGVPIELSVPFLIRARGWQIQAFCQEIGIHRAYLHALLQRLYAAGTDIRFAVRNRLGFDPWHETGSTRTGEVAPGLKWRLDQQTCVAPMSTP